MKRAFDVVTATFGTVARLGVGLTASHNARTPEKTLELYEYEACPHCRKVREALTELDLDVVIYPCPRGGTRYRPRAIEIGGKQLFPLLIDPNTGQVMYESFDIVDYLFATYGDSGPPARLRFAPVSTPLSVLASAVRPHRGRSARPSREPEQPLELYSFEASPYCRLVRETLCELELPYLLHNLGRGSTVDMLPPGLRKRFTRHIPASTEKRREFVRRSGKLMVPYLVDPNTGVEMFESADINRYLIDTYGG